MNTNRHEFTKAKVPLVRIHSRLFVVGSAALRITGRNDGGGFHHQNDCSIRGAGAMPDAFGNDKSLLWLQINRAIFEIDDKMSLQNKEKLIVVVMFVPVVFALHDPEANDGIVHLAQRLVIP